MDWGRHGHHQPAAHVPCEQCETNAAITESLSVELGHREREVTQLKQRLQQQALQQHSTGLQSSRTHAHAPAAAPASRRDDVTVAQQAEELQRRQATIDRLRQERDALRQAEADREAEAHRRDVLWQRELKESQDELKEAKAQHEATIRQWRAALKRAQEERDAVSQTATALRQRDEQHKDLLAAAVKTREEHQQLTAKLRTAVDAAKERDAELTRLRAEITRLRAELARVKAQLVERASGLPPLRPSSGAPVDVDAHLFTDDTELAPHYDLNQGPVLEPKLKDILVKGRAREWASDVNLVSQLAFRRANDIVTLCKGQQAVQTRLRDAALSCITGGDAGVPKAKIKAACVHAIALAWRLAPPQGIMADVFPWVADLSRAIIHAVADALRSKRIDLFTDVDTLSAIIRLLDAHCCGSTQERDATKRFWIPLLDKSPSVESNKALFETVWKLKAHAEGRVADPLKYFNAHPNDPMKFQEIAVLPIAAELEPDSQASNLPKELESTSYATTEEALQRVLNRHFRLVRENFLIPIREAVGQFRKLVDQPPPKVLPKGKKPEHDKLDRALPRDKLFESVRVRLEATVDRDMNTMAEITWLPSNHPVWSHAGSRADFWRSHERSLAEGSVVIFFATDSTAVTGSGYISRRDPRDLAGTQNRYGSEGKPPSVCVRLCRDMLLQQHQPTHRMVVLRSLQIFDVVPVLHRLQSARMKDFSQAGRELLLPSPRPVMPDPEDPLLRNAFTHFKGMTTDQWCAAASACHPDRKLTLIQGPPGTGKTFVGARVIATLLDGVASREPQAETPSTLGSYFWSSKPAAPPAKSLDLPAHTVLLVCYTNHALDQLMLRLFELDPDARGYSARLGSASRVDPALEDICMRVQRNQLPHEAHRERCKLQDEIEELLDFINAARGTVPDLQLLCGIDGETFGPLCISPRELAWLEGLPRKDMRSSKGASANMLLEGWYEGHKHAGFFKESKPRDHEFGTEKMIKDARDKLFAKPREARRSLVDDALRLARKQIAEKLIEVEQLQKRVDAIVGKNQTSLAGKQFIGCTTSYAAKNVALLRSLGINALVVEEAAEILEAHVLATLTASVDRVVLIGDHKQLRPKVEYTMKVASKRGYSLDRSVFERLIVKNGSKPFTLVEQHRMFPALSSIVKDMTYENLHDSERVLQRYEANPSRKCVPGLEKNRQLFFVNTPFPEVSGSDNTSKSNPEEATFVAATVRHLLRNGEDPSNVTVLSPYLGQVTLIRQRLQQMNVGSIMGELDSAEADLSDDSVDGDAAAAAPDGGQKTRQANSVRVASVDNFQGEENRIIIVSLVRSNNEGTIGWLKEPERVNVLLSRARDALLLVGNGKTFKDHASWKTVFTALHANGAVSSGLKLMCRAHADQQPAVVKSVKDFDAVSPAGGCTQPCGRKLPCGHLCSRRCHFDDSGHTSGAKDCKVVVEVHCEHGHFRAVPCNTRNDPKCPRCAELARQRESQEKFELTKRVAFEKKQQEFEDQKKRLRREAEEARDKAALGKFTEQVKEELDIMSRRHTEELAAIEAQKAAMREELNRKLGEHAEEMQKRREQQAAKFKEKEAQAQAQITRQQELLKADEQAHKDELEAHRRRHEEQQRRLLQRQDAMRRELRGAAADVEKQLKQVVECALCACDDARENMIQSVPHDAAAAAADVEPVADDDGAEHQSFYCCECVEHTAANARLLFDPDGLECPMSPAHYLPQFVVSLMSQKALDTVVKRREKHIEKQTVAETEKRTREEVLREVNDPFVRCRKHIEDEILVHRCPRCNAPFDSFDGCCAMRCALCEEAKQPHWFCAWCFTATDGDAHPHVEGCAEAPQGVNSTFPNIKDPNVWSRFARNRKLRLAKEYINKAPVAEGVRARLQQWLPTE